MHKAEPLLLAAAASATASARLLLLLHVRAAAAAGHRSAAEVLPVLWGIHDKYLSRENTLPPEFPCGF
jgi:hypothetical protein